MFQSLDNEVAEVIALAYVGCVDAQGLVGYLAAVTTRAVQQLRCIADAWAGFVTPEVIAASLAYGNGLDDLPDEVVDEMVLTTAACVPDRQWWIDDEIAVLGQRLEPEHAACFPPAIVDALGVGPIIRRRVLTLAGYPVPLAALRGAIAGPCDVRLADPVQLGPPGTCLAGFGDSATTAVISCAQPHNAEVVSLIDLSAEHPTWPGAQVLRDMAGTRCLAEVKRCPATSPHTPAAGTFRTGLRGNSPIGC